VAIFSAKFVSRTVESAALRFSMVTFRVLTDLIRRFWVPLNSSCSAKKSDAIVSWLTLSIISQARKAASKIYAIIPYMGYARQDRQFLSGEIVTMSIVAKMLEAAGAKKIIVVDIHSKTALNHFKISKESISAIPELAKYFKKLKLKNALVVSPDMGGALRAKKFASLLNTDFIALKKSRNMKTGKVLIQSSKVDVRGKDLILVDDIISTGGSIVKAAQFLKRQKCKRVFVACTHGLFVEGAEKKIKKAGVSRIISTNTIPRNTSKVDVSGVIVDSIR